MNNISHSFTISLNVVRRAPNHYFSILDRFEIPITMIIAVFSFIYFYLGFSFSEFFPFIVFAVLVSFPMFDKILPHTGHERRNFFKRIFNHSKMVTRYLVLLVLSASYGSGALRHLKLKGDESVVISSGVVDLEISIVLSLSNGFLGYQYDGMLPGYVYVSEARELIAR